jgi:hypothetical protein
MGAAIGALEARDVHTPIGMVLPVGWDDDGVATWRLAVHGIELPGRSPPRNGENCTPR